MLTSAGLKFGLRKAFTSFELNRPQTALSHALEIGVRSVWVFVCVKYSRIITSSLRMKARQPNTTYTPCPARMRT